MALTIHEEVAQRLGYPATLFGLTPNDKNYWREPGLPWLTPPPHEAAAAGYGPRWLLPLTTHFEGNDMAPRFPDGCSVAVQPVLALAQLRVGCVYLYGYRNQVTGAREHTVGRLVAIYPTHLEVAADNHPMPALWALRDKAGQETWDLREITHYVGYPLH